MSPGPAYLQGPGRDLQQPQSASESAGVPAGRRPPIRAAAHGQQRQAEAGTRPPRGRAYPSGEYSRLKTAPWVRVLRYTESAGWMEP